MRNILLFLTLISIAFPVVSQEKQAGKTLLTQGHVIDKRGVGTVKLKRRSPIYEKDEIHVGTGGRAQFRMVDHALLSLQENSVLQIKAYKYTQGDPKNSVLLELLTGGLRTITGAIGKGNKKAYELRTPMATIGIRGTDYEVEITPKGMYVAVWDGSIILRSRLKKNHSLLIGKNQQFMFAFINSNGSIHGLQNAPNVFKTGHSSNISHSVISGNFSPMISKRSSFEPLLQRYPDKRNVFNHKGLIINQSRTSSKIKALANAIGTSDPLFKVGLEQYNLAKDGQVSDFQQSVGGYQVSWGYWNKFSSSQATAQNDLVAKGMLWTAYDSTDPAIVAARTGKIRYDSVTNSLLRGSAGPVNNLKIQMDVNFESGKVTKGALSANTSSDTWIAVFDGKITHGDIGLQLNGASVIGSDPATQSPVRDADGFISGDFVGNNANAILGGFGLTEKNNETNHIEGMFIVKEHN